MGDRPSYLDEPLRPIAPDEVAVLERILEADLLGAERLRDQVRELRVRRSCLCGCPSVALFHPDDRREPAENSGGVGPLPIHVTIRPEGDDAPGGVIVRVSEDGYLADLEIYSHGEKIESVPRVDRLEVVATGP